MLATPAKWNVLRVICVPGSPMDCAPIAPTAVPGCMRFCSYRSAHVSRNSWPQHRGAGHAGAEGGGKGEVGRRGVLGSKERRQETDMTESMVGLLV